MKIWGTDEGPPEIMLLLTSEGEISGLSWTWQSFLWSQLARLVNPFVLFGGACVR